MKINAIKKICCIGVGTIGSSWVTLFLKNGYHVNVYDSSQDSLDIAPQKILNNFQIFMDCGVINKTDIKNAMNRVSFYNKLDDAIKDVQFIQESVLERLDIKQDMLEKIDAINTTALICSSTSCLNLSDITKNTKYANRCLCAHPYNPPHLMPLVEITQGDTTDPEMITFVREFYKSMGKEPVVLKKESPGFICNRLQSAFVKEAIEIVMDGVCTIEDLDIAAVYGLGIRWAIVGPNLNGELNGGEGGIHEYFEKFRANSTAAYRRILASKINEVPFDYSKTIAPEGIAIEKENRLPETGNTREEIIAYRDKMLIEILRLHNKL